MASNFENGNFLDMEAERDVNASMEDVLRLFWESQYVYSEFSNIILMVCYVPVFLTALLGNLLVLIIIYLNRRLQNVTNYFLTNLAVADILVSIVCIPMAIGQAIYKVWIYGEFMCKMTAFLQGTTVAASIFTIATLSLDRYFAIRHPMIFRRISTAKMAGKLILVIWILSLGIMVPLILVKRLETLDIIPGEPLHFCNEIWIPENHRHAYDVSLFVIVYAAPGCIIICSYVLIGRQLWTEDTNLQRRESEVSKGLGNHVLAGRKRIAKMLIVLAILFAVCWLPYYIVTLYVDFKRDKLQGFLTVLPYTILLGHSNSAFNPILYFYASQGFRRCVVKFLRCRKYNIAHGSAANVVVRYTTRNGALHGQDTRKPLIRRISNSSLSSKSRSSGSLRYSRSSNTSLRSSKSSRSSNNTRVQEFNGNIIYRDTDKRYYIESPETDVKEPCDSNHIDINLDQRHRRAIFNCTLSIPTTINEESKL